MATIDRFKEPLEKGGLTIDGKFIPLTAQMKYDYMAAVHTMEQLLDITAAIDKQNKTRDAFHAKISSSAKILLKKIVDSDELITLKQIDAAIQGLKECQKELIKLDATAKETAKLSEYIRDGISAGR